MLSKQEVAWPDYVHQRDVSAAESVIITYNAGWRNYYHFLLQSAFSSWLISKKLGFEGIFVFPNLNDRFREILLFCGVNRDKSEFLHKNVNVQLSNVAIIDTTYDGYVYRPSSLLPEFGKYLATRAGAYETRARKVYVSRRDSSNRVMANEQDLELVLRHRGFEVVTLSNLSFKQQIEVFQSADTIVAPHGAGLANLLFSRPGANIIELSMESYLNQCFLRLSQTMGLRHTLCVFPGDVSQVEQQKMRWRVGIDKVESLLDELDN
jgi:capsular polysaccharide biosynthesis protein